MGDEEKSCGNMDPLMFPEHLVTDYTTGPSEAGLFVLNFIFTIIGLSANTFGLVFFIKKQRKDVTTVLFIFLCAVDLCTCITLGPLQLLINTQVINFFHFSQDNFELFSVLSALFSLEVRFSMFLFMMMSFCRCMAIVSPFRTQNTKIIIGITGFYTSLLMVMCFYPVFVCSDFSYTIVPFARIGQMEFLSSLNGHDEDTLDISNGHTYHTVYLIFMEIITMMVPIIPIVITSSITAYNLVFSRMTQGAKARRDSAITILLLTFSTLVCFTPRLAIVISTLVTAPKENASNLADAILSRDMASGYAILYIFLTGLSIANSAINPCIFLARAGNMQRYLRKSLYNVYSASTTAIRGMGRSRNVSLYTNRTAMSTLHSGSTALKDDSKLYTDTQF